MASGRSPKLARRFALAATVAGVIALAVPAHAAFPGKAGLIAFTDDAGRLATVRADGTHEQRLLRKGFDPAWSPNGKRIAFARSFRKQHGDRANSELVLARADGSRKRTITDLVSDESEPAFSPSGRQIAFVSDKDGDDDIYVIDLKSRRVRQLTQLPGDERHPSWSVNDEIAFDASGQIYVAAAAGGPAELIGSGRAPDWSPDGQSIAFVDEQAPSAGPTIYYKVFTISRDGTGRTQLSPIDPTPDYAGDYRGAFSAPVFSPAGTSIVADYWPGSSLKWTKLVRIDLETGLGTDLAATDFYGAGANPDWQARR